MFKRVVEYTFLTYTNSIIEEYHLVFDMYGYFVSKCQKLPVFYMNSLC